MGRDQAKEIFEYVAMNPNADTEDIAQGTGWNRHVVGVALGIMFEKSMVQKTGFSEWGDPTWRVIR